MHASLRWAPIKSSASCKSAINFPLIWQIICFEQNRADSFQYFPSSHFHGIRKRHCPTAHNVPVCLDKADRLFSSQWHEIVKVPTHALGTRTTIYGQFDITGLEIRQTKLGGRASSPRRGVGCLLWSFCVQITQTTKAKNFTVSQTVEKKVTIHLEEKKLVK